MNNSKTLGCDGLPCEIYKTYWSTLGPQLLKALNLAFHKGILFRSGRRGMITLIPKKVRNQLYLKNWRPITLLNTDYKILAKAST